MLYLSRNPWNESQNFTVEISGNKNRRNHFEILYKPSEKRSHNSAKISKFTSHGIHLAKIKPQKPWTWDIIFWTQIHHSSTSFYSTLFCMEGQIQNWIWLVENYRGMVPTIVATNPTWVEHDSTNWLWIFISNIFGIGCNDWKWFSKR